MRKCVFKLNIKDIFKQNKKITEFYTVIIHIRYRATVSLRVNIVLLLDILDSGKICFPFQFSQNH